jgi:hypothetical protein
MEHRWNETDRGKPKYKGKNPSYCHFVHHKCNMDWTGIPFMLSRIPSKQYVSIPSELTINTLAYVSIKKTNPASIFREIIVH